MNLETLKKYRRKGPASYLGAGIGVALSSKQTRRDKADKNKPSQKNEDSNDHGSN